VVLDIKTLEEVTELPNDFVINDSFLAWFHVKKSCNKEVILQLEFQFFNSKTHYFPSTVKNILI
jgi:hypothetical protein